VFLRISLDPDGWLIADQSSIEKPDAGIGRSESFRVGCSCKNDSFCDGEVFFIDRSLLMGGNSALSDILNIHAVLMVLRYWQESPNYQQAGFRVIFSTYM
jgi:hypothetical protein